MIRTTTIVALVLAFWAQTARADFKQDVLLCSHKAAPDDVRIRACSRLMLPERFSKLNLSKIYINRASAYINKSRCDEAISDLNQALRLTPKNPRVFFTRAKCFEVIEEDKAIADFSRAIELKPDFAEAYARRGIIYAEGLGDVNRAFADFNQAARLGTKNPEVFVFRGAIYSQKGRLNDALGDFKKAIALGNDDPEILAAIRELKGSSGRNTQADRTPQRNRGEAFKFNERGLAAFKKGQYDLAITEISQAIHLDPGNAVQFNNRANVYYKKRQYDRAIDDFNQAIRLNPGYANAFYSRGAAYYNQGQYDNAITDLSEAILLQPSDPMSIMNRGVVYEKTGQMHKALQDYKEAYGLGHRSQKLLQKLRKHGVLQ